MKFNRTGYALLPCGAIIMGAMLFLLGGCNAKAPPEVRQAEQTLTNWLDGFTGQTQEQVRKSLGAPAKETRWLFNEKEEPLLKYKIGDSTELSLYFHNGRVVKVGLLLLP
jgi:hypothetical protein